MLCAQVAAETADRFDCQIIAGPMSSGKRLKFVPRPGSANGKENKTSGAARLSIHRKNGAFRNSMLLRRQEYKAKKIGI